MPPARTAAPRSLREPKPPQIPASLATAGDGDLELVHDGKYLSVAYGPVPLTSSYEEPVEDVEFERCRFTDTRFTGIRLDRAGLADVAFTGCDLANLRLFNSRLFNATVTDCRMTGLQLTEGGARDTVFDGCRADLSSFRFCHLRDVVFRECNLAEANFQNAELHNVRFEGCKLTAAQFSNATMRQVRFTGGCTLDGVSGINSFNGAIVSSTDALSLLEALAAALGITIEN